MALRNEEEINNIREQANIVDIISDYIELKKSGSDYVGKCPFHDDHSPSMHVSTKLNIFKCFVCNTGGNVFNFVQKYENVSYFEAVKIVAEKSGLNFNINSSSKSSSKYQEEYQIMDLSLKYYQNNLATQNGKSAKEYLMNRGINEQIMRDFHFGLSLDNNRLKEFLESKNCNLEKAYEIGLLNKDGIDYYDMFVNRIMIPIFDMQNHLVGYTARAYQKDEKNKYINTKDTAIYHKSDLLFNYYNAKNAIRENKQIILVEGNMDAISLASHGIKNVCALMGVVLSKNQIESIKRLNAKTILMLDSDSAGSMATIKVGDDLYNAGVDLHVVRLSGAKDPDEYLQKYGEDKLKENIANPIKYLSFKIEALKENRNLNDVVDKFNYLKDVIKMLGNVPELERELIVNNLCEEYNVDPSLLKKEIVVKDIKPKQDVVKSVNITKKSRYELAVSQMFYAMFLNKDYYQIYFNELGYLENKIERETATLIGSYIKLHNNIDAAGFLDYVLKYDDIYNYINEILTTNNLEEVSEKDFYYIVGIVTSCIKENEIKRIKQQIKEEQDVAKKMELIEKLAELKKGCGNYEGN